MSTVTTTIGTARAPADDAATAVHGLDDGRGTLRPDRALLRYYVLTSLVIGPAFPIVFLFRFFRYRTLRYDFDDEGITMRWGALFRREVSLTYARIQDIHLSSNMIERWLGLAKIEVQTASGSARAEMTIEGLREFEAIRDLLYSRMRGAGERRAHSGVGAAHAVRDRAAPAPVPVALAAGADDEVAAALREAAAELRALREELARRAPNAGGDGDA